MAVSESLSSDGRVGRRRASGAGTSAETSRTCLAGRARLALGRGGDRPRGAVRRATEARAHGVAGRDTEHRCVRVWLPRPALTVTAQLPHASYMRLRH